jgi:hypothetical protein
MAIADAFRSQSAWSCRKEGKSPITAATHSGRLAVVRSRDNFMRRQRNRNAPVFELPIGQRKSCSTALKARECLQAPMKPDRYYERFGALERQIQRPPRPDLGLIVVIPCFDETALLDSLESLRACEPPRCSVDVIVVINSSETVPEEALRQNRLALVEGLEWAAAKANPCFQVFFLNFPNLPEKHAGVGLARKIGMDEAARRFDDLNRPDGVIVCFDADTECDPNYLIAIDQHFQEHPKTPGCSIYFEHPLSGPYISRIYKGITLYELHLRYYVQALRFADFPHAHHTIGSSMAVRAGVYKKQGGMNKRQAGEDFYFLHKIIPLGGFTDLTTTRLIPAPRFSHRVPFGTGKAIGDYYRKGELKTYPLEAFLDLRQFFGNVLRLGIEAFDKTDPLPPSIVSFLAKKEFSAALEEMRRNCSSRRTFLKRFFQLFNGFEAMKFVHHARDKFYGEREIPQEARKLAQLAWPEDGVPSASRPKDLLLFFRAKERNLPGGPTERATLRIAASLQPPGDQLSA